MRFLNYVLGIVAIAALGTGCKKDRDTNIQPIDVTVNAAYEESLTAYGFTVENVTVSMKNTTTGAVLTQKTDKNGKAQFLQLASGRYEVTTNIAIDKATYESITGLELNSETANFNASQPYTLNPTTKNDLFLNMSLGTIGDWVIKQLYYAGSHTTNGASFRDQFIEVYNNSNKVLYADSLYFGQLMGNNSKYESVDLTKPFYINDASDALHKQFNWGKSIGITPADISASKNFVYMKSLFRIPGTGQQYPVQPGASIIIAATAQNHKAPFTDSEGTTISVKDPTLTVDLSGANFEVFLGGVIPNPLTSDVDNLNIPNVAVIEPGARDLVLDATGRDAIVIFKTNKSLPLYGQGGTKAFGYYPDPSTLTIDDKTSYYYQIPNDLIIDAVQVQHPNPNATQRVARKLVNAQDAGPTNVPNGQYSSQSLIRKTSKVIGTRKVLMDTNNSAADFDFFTMAQPGGFKN